MSDSLPIEIECSTVKARLDDGADLVLIDCREADEYALVRIEAALLLPMSQIVERVAELEPHRGRNIVIHCHHGGRSLRVVQWLRQQGFDMAQSMSGGIDRWAVEIDTTLARY